MSTRRHSRAQNQALVVGELSRGGQRGAGVVHVEPNLLLLTLNVTSVSVLYDQSGLVQFALLVVGQRQLSKARFDRVLVIARRGGRMEILTKLGRARRRVDVKRARTRRLVY